jgi:opacity protein-like surface antigen
MKKCTAFFFVYTIGAFAAGAQVQFSIGASAQVTAPNDVLSYRNGIGIYGSASLHHVYFATTLAAYGGSKTSTYYEANNGFPEGAVVFKSKPFLLAHDIGYDVAIRVAGKKTFLTPYVSLGWMIFSIESSQLYGTHTHLKSSLQRGCGITYSIPVLRNLYAGIHYRWYPFRDRYFEFGHNDASRVTYGFSSSISFSAIGLVLAYRFNTGEY